MRDLPPASEAIVSTYFSLPDDQRGGYLGAVSVTDIELSEILSRETPRVLAAWEQATRQIVETGATGADTAALVHGLVIRIARGDDPHSAIEELAAMLPDFYAEDGAA